MKYLPVILLLLSGSADAQLISTEKTYDESLRGRRTVVSLDAGLFGDQISSKDGAVYFSQTDVEVPTNSGLRVHFSRQSPRQKQGADRSSMPLGSGWELNVPYMMGTFDTRRGWDVAGGNRCSSGTFWPTQTVGPSPNYNTTVMPAHLYWSGTHINIPGAGNETLLKLLPGHPVPQDGGTYLAAASGFWRIGCLSNIKNGAGEGFVVRLPDGTKYYFDWMAIRNAYDALDSEYYRDGNGDGTNPTGLLVPTSDVFLYATKVEDRHGNYVNYTYDPVNKHRLTSIQSNDGALINVSYNPSGHVSTVSAQDRVWTYSYDQVQYGARLTQVLQPDGSAWKFSGSTMWWYAVSPKLPSSFYTNSCAQDPAGYRSQDPAAAHNLSTVTMTHPSGASGIFTFRSLIHGSDNTPGGCGLFGTSMTSFWFGSYGVPNAYLAQSIVTKKITGPGIDDQVWSYHYEPSWSFARDCSIGCQSRTRVTNPTGEITEYVYGNSYTTDFNLLLQVHVIKGGAVKRSVINTYQVSSANYPSHYGQIVTGNNGLESLYGNPTSYQIRPLKSSTVLQDGRVFSSRTDAYDNFARATTIVKWNEPAPTTP